MNKYYSISDIIICCKSDIPIETSKLFADFICEPAVPDITVNIIGGTLPETDGGIYKDYPLSDKKVRFSCKIKKAFNEYDLHIDYSDGLWDYAVFYALDFAPVLLENNRVMCHCSYVIRDGEAILFAGFKQVGKSTQAELWEKFGNAEVINGDRAILLKEGDRFLACGTPYCGSSKIALNRIAPIKAIILLSKSSENVASLVENRNECFKLIFPHLSYDDSHINEMLTLAQEICTAVPFYNYSCLPEKAAVYDLEKILWKH